MNSASRGSRNGERDSRLYAMVVRSRIMSDCSGIRVNASTYIILSIGSVALGASYCATMLASAGRWATSDRNRLVYSRSRWLPLNQKYWRLSE